MVVMIVMILSIKLWDDLNCFGDSDNSDDSDYYVYCDICCEYNYKDNLDYCET